MRKERMIYETCNMSNRRAQRLASKIRSLTGLDVERVSSVLGGQRLLTMEVESSFDLGLIKALEAEAMRD